MPGVSSTFITAKTVLDKTGYTLTAGSYSTRASSSQNGSFTQTAGTASSTGAISAITTTRIDYKQCGISNSSNGGSSDWGETHIDGSTTIQITRYASLGDFRFGYNLTEFF